jgi:hypothetical protein
MINRNFNEFTDFESLELEVPTFCFVTGCVSARRDRRYSFIYLRGRDLRPPNHEVFSAHRFFRHAGMDVILYIRHSRDLIWEQL